MDRSFAILSSPVAHGRAPRVLPSSPPDTVGRFLRGLTASQWLILIYPVFLFAVRRKRETDDVAGVDASAVFQIGFMGLCAVHVMRRLTSGRVSFGPILLKTPLRWLLMYGLMAVMSTAWSGIPALTLFRGSQVLVFLFLVADSLESFAGVEELLKFQLLYALLVGIFWQFTNLLDDRSFGSLHSSAVPGSIVGIVIAGFLVLGRQWQALFCAVALTALVGTSASTYLCLMLGVSFAVMTLRGRQATLGLIVVGLLVLAVLQFPGDSVRVVFYGKADNQILNGTGRVPVWEWLIRTKVSERPLVGFGFGFGEVQARLFNEGASALKMLHLHNAFMSALVNLGGIGTLLLLAFWGGILRATWKLRGYPLRPVMIAAVIATLLNSLSMESVSAPLTYGWIGHLLIYATAVKGCAEAAVPAWGAARAGGGA